MNPGGGEGRPHVPYLILGLPLGVLVLVLTFVAAPLADFTVGARTQSGAILFAAIAIVGAAAADYDAARKRRSARPMTLGKFEWRTITQTELRQVPIALPILALVLPLAGGWIFRDEWFGLPLGFAVGCLCALGLMAYTQWRSRL
jgi:hypothetical protein